MITPDLTERQKRVLIQMKKDPVFFAEKALLDEAGNNYELEPHQKQFLRDPNQFKLLYCSRRAGKSFIMGVLLLHKAIFQRNTKNGLISATTDQARTFASDLEDMIERSPALENEFLYRNKMDYKLNNGSRIVFKTAGSSSGQKGNSSAVGSGYSLMLIDEFQSVDIDDLKTIMPIITGQSKIATSNTVLAGTPRTVGSVFWDLITNNCKYLTENGKRTLIDPTKHYSVHKFVICGIDEETGHVLWSAAPERIPASELEVIRTTIGSQAFAQEYLLDFGETVTMPFPDTLVDRAAILKEPNGFRSNRIAVAGMDPAKYRDNSVISVATLEMDGTWHCKYFHAFKKGTEYKTMGHFVNTTLKKNFPLLKRLVVDITGVGGAFVEFINKNVPFIVDGFLFSAPSKVNLVENAVTMMEEEKFRVWPHPTLRREWSEYSRELSDSGRIKYNDKTSDDYLDATNLTALAANEFSLKGAKASRNPAILSLNTKANNVIGLRPNVLNQSPVTLRDSRLSRRV